MSSAVLLPKCRNYQRCSGRSSESICRVSHPASKFGAATNLAELQGHAIKNKDLLAASGAITLRGPESFDELQEDEQAVRCRCEKTLVADEIVEIPITIPKSIASASGGESGP